MTPEVMAKSLLKAHGKSDAKRVAETTLKMSENENTPVKTKAYWRQVVSILKK